MIEDRLTLGKMIILDIMIGNIIRQIQDIKKQTQDIIRLIQDIIHGVLIHNNNFLDNKIH